VATAASYAGFRYPGEIISHAVWLYFRFALSWRDVSELMLARGVMVSHETIRQHSYSKDGVMRIHNVTDPVYFPNSKGGSQADVDRYGQPAGWYSDGEMVHAAYTLHAEDDDWSQAGALVREVMDDAARTRLVNNIVGQLLNGVTEPVLLRTFDYLRNVDKDLGDRVEQDIRAGQS
jgi:catalase